jgi:hypothetical protein
MNNQLAKEHVYYCGDVECFGLWKRLPSSFGPPNVCLHHLIGFWLIFLVGVKQHLLNFLSLYCRVNGTSTLQIGLYIISKKIVCCLQGNY